MTVPYEMFRIARIFWGRICQRSAVCWTMLHNGSAVCWTMLHNALLHTQIPPLLGFTQCFHGWFLWKGSAMKMHGGKHHGQKLCPATQNSATTHQVTSPRLGVARHSKPPYCIVETMQFNFFSNHTI